MKTVTYIGGNKVQKEWADCSNPDGVLQENSTYTVKEIEVHSWHTKYILVEYPLYKFNSVLFTSKR